MASTRNVVLTVEVDGDDEVVKAWEVLSRAAAGLTLDGLETRVWSYTDDDGFDDEEELVPGGTGRGEDYDA